HSGDRSRRPRHQEVLDPVRCDREGVGALRGVGFRRRRRVRAADLAGAVEDDDGQRAIAPQPARRKGGPNDRDRSLCMHRTLIRSGSAVMMALLLHAGAAFAQGAASSAMISGVITDESGAALPGVTATLTSPALQVRQVVVVSDASGNYRFGELPVGTYRVIYELQGFTSFV